MGVGVGGTGPSGWSPTELKQADVPCPQLWGQPKRSGKRRGMAVVGEPESRDPTSIEIKATLGNNLEVLGGRQVRVPGLVRTHL
jgi:hypothetical protein